MPLLRLDNTTGVRYNGKEVSAVRLNGRDLWVLDDEPPVVLPDPRKHFRLDGDLTDAVGGDPLVGTGIAYGTGVHGQSLRNTNAVSVPFVNPSIVTMAGWVNVQVDPVNDIPLFGFWDSPNAGGSSMFALYNRRTNGPTPNNVDMSMSVRGGGSLQIRNVEGYRLPVGEWHHVAVTFHQPTGVLEIYVDAVLRATSSIAGSLNLAGMNFVLESAAWTDDVYVFNEVLSQEQIEYLSA